jgi:hypothetical protein
MILADVNLAADLAARRHKLLATKAQVQAKRFHLFIETFGNLTDGVLLETIVPDILDCLDRQVQATERRLVELGVDVPSGAAAA